MKFLLSIISLTVFCTVMVSAGTYRHIIQRSNSFKPLVQRKIFPSNHDRVKRQLSGSVVSNPIGAPTVNLQASHGIGNPTHNLIGTAFASGIPGGQVTRGGQLDYNLHGHGASLSQIHQPSVGDISKIGARVNLLNSGNHKIDANAFKSSIDHVSGLILRQHGGSLDYNHARGHGLSLGASQTHIPAFPNVNLGTKFDLTGKANLWRDRSTSLDLSGTASRTNGGINHGATNFGANLGLTRWFG